MNEISNTLPRQELPKRPELLAQKASHAGLDAKEFVVKVDSAAARVDKLLQRVRTGGGGLIEVFESGRVLPWSCDLARPFGIVSGRKMRPGRRRQICAAHCCLPRFRHRPARPQLALATSCFLGRQEKAIAAPERQAVARI